MDDQNKNLILATALSFLVILVWFVVFPPEDAPQTDDQSGTETAMPDAATPQTAAPGTDPGATGATAVPDSERVEIDTPSLAGGITLTGGRFDQLALKNYHVTVDPDSPIVDLLRPLGAVEPYLAVFGWAPGGNLGFDAVPGAETQWTVESGDVLTPDQDVVLRWESPAGLIFRRRIAVDAESMFTVTQEVSNNSDAAIRMAPYGRIERYGEPSNLKGFFIIHEGAFRQTGEELQRFSYSNLTDFERDGTWGANADVAQVQQNGWIGFTDHYWQTVLIPPQDQAFTGVVQYGARDDVYQTTARLGTEEVAPGDTAAVTTRLFAGAKTWTTLREYQNEAGVYNFVDSIDWGWFYFLTKPIFRALHNIELLIGNMGWSIIVLTLGIKALLFPLAYKSYVSMAKMKELQPEMEKIKERTGEDRQKLQQEMMQLYKSKKVNPAAGCLPILLQIPIFFSLYKVIFVTIDLRHAPWFGPFDDLSAPDPTSILNVFGLMPWSAPDPQSLLALVFIGILPIILGTSMWMQQKLNPAPADPTQAMIFAWMPWVFMFMLGSFASGLVVYWIANNLITFAQQYTIMRSQGAKIDFLGNVKSSFRRGKKDEG